MLSALACAPLPWATTLPTLVAVDLAPEADAKLSPEPRAAAPPLPSTIAPIEATAEEVSVATAVAVRPGSTSPA